VQKSEVKCQPRIFYVRAIISYLHQLKLSLFPRGRNFLHSEKNDKTYVPACFNSGLERQKSGIKTKEIVQSEKRYKWFFCLGTRRVTFFQRGYCVTGNFEMPKQWNGPAARKNS
jgi:hypothetical protein